MFEEETDRNGNATGYERNSECKRLGLLQVKVLAKGDSPIAGHHCQRDTVIVFVTAVAYGHCTRNMFLKMLLIGREWMSAILKAMKFSLSASLMQCYFMACVAQIFRSVKESVGQN